jgi:hypothetical protein
MVSGFDQLGHTPVASIFLFMIHGATLLGLLWLSRLAVCLFRNHQCLQRARELFRAEALGDALTTDVRRRCAAAVETLPAGWTRSRVEALLDVSAMGGRGADALRDLVRQDAARATELPRLLSGVLVLLGLAGAIAVLGVSLTPGHHAPAAAGMPTLHWAPLLRAALFPAFVGVVSASVLALLTAILRQFQQVLLSRLETFSLTVLEPRILPTDSPAALTECVALLAVSSRQLGAVAQPFVTGLERVSDQFRDGADEFSRRLEHASHNLLQCVESVRAAATEFGRSAGSVGDQYERLEAMQRHVEEIASQLAGSHEQSRARLDTIAEGLYGITQSLTTVVASANQAQETVSGVAGTMSGSVQRLDESIERLVQNLQDSPGAAGGVVSAGSGNAAGVTLRQMVEVQRQFINTLDHRLSRFSATTPRDTRTPERLNT